MAAKSRCRQWLSRGAREREGGVMERNNVRIPRTSVEFLIRNWMWQMLHGGRYDSNTAAPHPPRHRWGPRLLWPWRHAVCWYCGLRAASPWWR